MSFLRQSPRGKDAPFWRRPFSNLVDSGKSLPLHRRIPLVVCAMLLSACQQPIDTTAVQNYVKAVISASASFDAFSSSLIPLCETIREYSSTTPRELKDVPQFDPSPAPALAGSGPGATNDPPDCDRAATASAQWMKRDQVIVAYVRSLGAIADVDTKPSGLDKLTGELADAGLMKKAQSGPFASVGTDIANLLLEGKRDALLRKFVNKADQPLHEAVAGLLAATDAYDLLLDDERTLINNTYHIHVRRLANSSTGDLYELHRVRQEWANLNLAIDLQRAKEKSYADALDQIALTNRKLCNASKSGASMGDLIRATSAYLGPLVRDLAALQRAK